MNNAHLLTTTEKHQLREQALKNRIANATDCPITVRRLRQKVFEYDTKTSNLISKTIDILKFKSNYKKLSESEIQLIKPVLSSIKAKDVDTAIKILQNSISKP